MRKSLKTVTVAALLWASLTGCINTWPKTYYAPNRPCEIYDVSKKNDIYLCVGLLQNQKFGNQNYYVLTTALTEGKALNKADQNAEKLKKLTLDQIKAIDSNHNGIIDELEYAQAKKLYKF